MKWVDFLRLKSAQAMRIENRVTESLSSVEPGVLFKLGVISKSVFLKFFEMFSHAIAMGYEADERSG